MRRRGSVVRCTWTGTEAVDRDGRRFRVVDLELDLPQSREAELKARLTDFMVRAAEALRSADDVYHVVRREASQTGPVAVPVGPLVQELGERFSLALARPALAFRTQVWLTLPAETRLAEVVDPVDYDPQSEGEPDGLLRRAGLRWAAVCSFGRVEEAAHVRFLLWVPVSSAATVEALLGRLRESLSR